MAPVGQSSMQRTQLPHVLASGASGVSLQVGDHLAQEHPRAVRRREDVGVLAEPAQAGARGGGAVVHGAVVHEHAGAHLPSRQRRQRVGEAAQARLEQLVVVVAPGVAGHLAAKGIVVGLRLAGVVADGERDDRLRALQQAFWTVGLADALFGVPGQAVHQPVAHALHRGALVAQERLGSGDAGQVEAVVAGALLDARRQVGRAGRSGGYRTTHFTPILTFPLRGGRDLLKPCAREGEGTSPPS